MSIAGLGLFLVGVILLDKSSNFAGLWALLPTLSAAILIISGSKSAVNEKILSKQVLVWLGLISFPLYLWHWPLLSFALIIQGEASPQLRLGIVIFLLFWHGLHIDLLKY